jgi:hypothetical protein
MKIIRKPNDEQLSAWLGEQSCNSTIFMINLDYFGEKLPSKIKWPDDWPDLERDVFDKDGNGPCGHRAGSADLCVICGYRKGDRVLWASSLSDLKCYGTLVRRYRGSVWVIDWDDGRRGTMPAATWWSSYGFMMAKKRGQR